MVGAQSKRRKGRTGGSGLVVERLVIDADVWAAIDRARSDENKTRRRPLSQSQWMRRAIRRYLAHTEREYQGGRAVP